MAAAIGAVALRGQTGIGRGTRQDGACKGKLGQIHGGAHADGHDQGRSFFVERSWDDQKSECVLWGLAVGAGLYLSAGYNTKNRASARPAS